MFDARDGVNLCCNQAAIARWENIRQDSADKPGWLDRTRSRLRLTRGDDPEIGAGGEVIEVGVGVEE